MAWQFPNDTGAWYCYGCMRTIFGWHACTGPMSSPQHYVPLNPNVRLGPIPRELTEEDVRRIVREELARVAPPAGGE